MSEEQCLVAFCESEERFLLRYIVYFSLRARGWIPRSGLKFGTDFVVYSDRPSVLHAEYCVAVRSVDEGPFVWKDLTSISRTASGVAKVFIYSLYIYI